MKLFKSLLIVLIVLVNLAFAQPTLADQPKFLKNPDYIEVTKNLNELKKAKETQAQTDGYSPEEIQQKIDQLEFQKYALETGINWGKCINETGKTLAVYGPTPDFDDDDDDDDDDSYTNSLYFLANGQATKDKWDCEGVYLPNDAKTTLFNADGNSEEANGPIAIKIADGSQLVVKTNPITGAFEFNVPPTKVVTGEDKWFIPNVAQILIDNRVPNAPGIKIANATDLVGQKNPSTRAVQSPPQTQPQPEPKLQPQPEIKLQPNLLEKGYYRK